MPQELRQQEAREMRQLGLSASEVAQIMGVPLSFA
jgi:predicted transcriptional regulator